jgi:hypothetical protein
MFSNTAQFFTGLFVTNASNGIVGNVYGSVQAGYYSNMSFSNYITGLSAGSVTFKLRAQSALGSTTLLASGSDYLSFWIEDIGTA